MARLTSSPTGRSLLPLLALALVAQHAQAADPRDWIRRGTEAIERRVPNQQKQQNAPNPTVDQVTGLVGLTAVGVCSKQVGQDQEKQLVCMAGGLALAGVTKLIGNKISAGLKERDQREILTAASDSLRTGEPTTVTLPESGSVVRITSSPDAEQKSIRYAIQIDSAAVNADLPTLHVIGGTYRANQSAGLSNSAADKAKSVGTVNKDEDIHVFGKAGDSDKLLVARWVMAEGDLYPKPMAIGYASPERLTAVEKDQGTAQENIKTAPETRKSVEVNFIVTCRDQEMERSDPDGKVIEDKFRRCNGPDGIPLGS
jgi:uncharacterized protein YcfJ